MQLHDMQSFLHIQKFAENRCDSNTKVPSLFRLQILKENPACVGIMPPS